MAKYLGISVDVLDGDSSFVLVKLLKNAGSIDVDGRSLSLSAGPAQAANSVRAGDADSVHNFVQKFGSHYLQSVTVGDAIYQVIALTKDNMMALKANVGQGPININDWSRIYDTFLAPWKVRETGDIRVASGDVQLTRFVEQELRLNAQFGSYGDLVGSLISNPEKVRMLEQLGRDTKAIIGVNFASLKPWVGGGNIQIREYYDEIVDTNSALWEANL